MAQAGYTEQQLRETREAVERFGTQAEAARQLGIPETTFNSRYKAAARRGYIPTSPPPMPGYEISKHTEVFNPKTGEVERTFTQQKPEPEGSFQMPEGHSIKGISTLVDGSGRKVAEWIKTREDNTTSIADIKAAFDDFAWKPIKVAAPKSTLANLLTIYPIADLHLSLRAKADESGADYNLEIAAKQFTEKADQLFAQSPQSGTALIAYLGDWTHQNDDKNITPRSGHFLQVSDDVYSTVRVGVQLAIAHAYKALERHKKVIIKVVKGNHDLETWMALCIALEQHFSKEKRVVVDTGLADYWFMRWGVNLLGLHHGHRLKPEQMAGAMATECAEDWGETLYRLFLHGHLHHRRVIDSLGVLVECMRTLAAVDQHYSGKYGSPRSLVSITLDKEQGEVGRSFVNLEPVRRRAVAA